MQQSNSLDFKLVQRVCLLQQALDQALESLEELAAQVQDKCWVETQLASTEKYANVQQQAITHLKQQLAQFAEIQDHLLGVMGFRLNELIGQQQQTFDQLNIQFQQSHTELQTYLQYLTHQQQTGETAERGSEAHYRTLEAEVMVARSMTVHLSQSLGLAKQHLDYLSANLGNHHLNFGHIIKTIQVMIADLASFDPSTRTPPPLTEAGGLSEDWAEGRSLPALATTVDPVLDIEALQADVRRQQVRIQELHAALTEQANHETHLRQRYQEVAAERDYYRRELQKIRQSRETSAIAPPATEPMLQFDGPDSRQDTQPWFPMPQRSRPSQPIQPLQLPEA